MPLISPHPPLRNHLDGLPLLGGQPTAENLVVAYAQGIFLWPVPGWPLA